jgi:hypothetical protein
MITLAAEADDDRSRDFLRAVWNAYSRSDPPQ